MTTSIGSIKPGASFSLPVRLHPVVEGTPVADLTGWTAQCQLRRADGRLVADLDASWADAEARLLLLSSTAQNTATWPTASLLLDIRLTSPDGAVTVVSATLALTVAPRITQ